MFSGCAPDASPLAPGNRPFPPDGRRSGGWLRCVALARATARGGRLSVSRGFPAQGCLRPVCVPADARRAFRPLECRMAFASASATPGVRGYSAPRVWGGLSASRPGRGPRALSDGTPSRRRGAQRAEARGRHGTRTGRSVTRPVPRPCPPGERFRRFRRGAWARARGWRHPPAARSSRRAPACPRRNPWRQRPAARLPRRGRAPGRAASAGRGRRRG